MNQGQGKVPAFERAEARVQVARLEVRPRVLLVGANGFIGSAVSNLLDSLGWGATRLVRTKVPSEWPYAVAYGDLTDQASLAEACAGHDVVINVASYVGNDSHKQNAVNAVGSANLAEAAAAAGISRVIYVSSTSVYGGKAANGSAESENYPVPRSTLSVSRLSAEMAVINVGGVVLRAHLVYGPGDRFFLGPLIRAIRTLDGLIESGSARISTISTDGLARLILGAATDSSGQMRGQVFHAAHPTPTTVAELVTAAWSSSARSLPLRTVSAEFALNRLGGNISRSQIEMVAHDNWLDSSLIWRVLQLDSGPSIQMTADSHGWYRHVLLGLDRENRATQDAPARADR